MTREDELEYSGIILWVTVVALLVWGCFGCKFSLFDSFPPAGLTPPQPTATGVIPATAPVATLPWWVDERVLGGFASATALAIGALARAHYANKTKVDDAHRKIANGKAGNT